MISRVDYLRQGGDLTWSCAIVAVWPFVSCACRATTAARALTCACSSALLGACIDSAPALGYAGGSRGGGAARLHDGQPSPIKHLEPRARELRGEGARFQLFACALSGGSGAESRDSGPIRKFSRGPNTENKCEGPAPGAALLRAPP